MKNIINRKEVDYKTNPIFFGKDLSLQRYDRFKYKKIFNNYKTQLGYFWRPEEVSLGGKERNEFNSLSAGERNIFLYNISSQILLDSVQGRGLKYIQECCTNPELEAALSVYANMEVLHSYSYTYIIKDLLPDPTKFFDDILLNKEIEKRTTAVTKYYNELIEALPNSTLAEKKKKLYLTLVSINILEGIRFYVSFACSFSLAEAGKMEGVAKIISFILRDENLHLGLTQSLIKILRTEESEGFVKIAEECEDLVYQMYKDSAQEEIDWAEYIFSEGSLIGLNAEILTLYMKWLTNKRLRGIGLKYIFEGAKNPINWMNNWTQSGAVAVAPQEVEVEQYVKGGAKNDIGNVSFSDFKL